jgi:nitrite reductase/ring-hydroxylating ferredoxin subunit
MVKFVASQHIGAIEVCDADELWDGEMECFRVGDTAILLLKLDGQFHAWQGHCPHQGVALVEGDLSDGVLTCAAHRWQFDATTGHGVNPRSAQLKCFPVHVVDGKVIIELERSGGNADQEPPLFSGRRNAPGSP